MFYKFVFVVFCENLLKVIFGIVENYLVPLRFKILKCGVTIYYGLGVLKENVESYVTICIKLVSKFQSEKGERVS